MLEHELLREQFEDLLRQERDALAAYDALAGHVTDPGVRAELDHLRKDKARHVELAERLLEILE